jgi:hypothetical protein
MSHWKIFHGTAAAALALGLIAAPPVMAQVQQTPPPAPSMTTARADRTDGRMIEGPVKKVDPGAGTLRVGSGPFGLFSKTVEVGSDTDIRMSGHRASLTDIPEGTRVTVAYESRDGKNVATRIDATATR